MTADYSRMFKNWNSDISLAPRDGTWFMGRITGTNRAKAVHFEAGVWQSRYDGPIDICQWISYVDYADIKDCAWRRM